MGKQRLCSLCKQPGHYSPKCPNIQEEKKEPVEIKTTQEKIWENVDTLFEEELWEIESEHQNFVINNQVWKYYPKYEKWIKCSNNFEKIKQHFTVMEPTI